MMMSLAARYMFFLSVWLMIANWSDTDIQVGLLASALALWISLALALMLASIAFSLSRGGLIALACAGVAGLLLLLRDALLLAGLHAGADRIPADVGAGGGNDIARGLSDFWTDPVARY